MIAMRFGGFDWPAPAGAKALPQSMEAPSGLKTASPQGFQVLRNGFRRAGEGLTKILPGMERYYKIAQFKAISPLEVPMTLPSLPWWQRGVVYQIYPRSFKYSKGDGDGWKPL